jgi:hypothetical protein
LQYGFFGPLGGFGPPGGVGALRPTLEQAASKPLSHALPKYSLALSGFAFAPPVPFSKINATSMHASSWPPAHAFS